MLKYIEITVKIINAGIDKKLSMSALLKIIRRKDEAV